MIKAIGKKEQKEAVIHRNQYPVRFGDVDETAQPL